MRSVTFRWFRGLNKSKFLNPSSVENRYFVSYVATRVVECEKCFPASPINNIKVTQKWSHNCITRHFSTSPVAAKLKGGEKKKAVKATHINLNEVAQFVNVDQLTKQLEKAVEDLKENFVKHLTLRSASGSIEQVVVTFEGQEYLLQELVQVARKPKTVVLNVSVFPQAIPQILEALDKSGMNLNPQQDGTTIFVPIPKVTKEHREKLSKNAKALFIKCRDNIKEIRTKTISKLKTKESISTDDVHRIQAQLEALCEKYINDAEKILVTKQNELLSSSG